MKTKTHDNLKQYETARAKLETEKADLEERLATINAALGHTTNGTAAPVQSRRQRSNQDQPSLRSLVEQITSRTPKSKADIMAEVMSRGYRFTTEHPMKSLNALLYSQFKNRNGLFGPKL